MANSFSFTIVSELTTSDGSGSIALTKKLSFWQLISAKWADNLRIKRILFIYEPRAGELGRGEVTAQIIDNRIDEDLDDNVLKEITFDVRQEVNITWEHDVQLCLGDLKKKESEPILLRTSVSGSNVKTGFSLGQIRINIEIATNNKMVKAKVKPAVVKLSPLPNRAIERSKSFQLTDVKGKAKLEDLGGSKKYRLKG